jgi:uncharacterized protein (TIGR03000 family)
MTMFKRWLSPAGVLLLAGAVLLLVPTTGRCDRFSRWYGGYYRPGIYRPWGYNYYSPWGYGYYSPWVGGYTYDSNYPYMAGTTYAFRPYYGGYLPNSYTTPAVTMQPAPADSGITQAGYVQPAPAEASAEITLQIPDSSAQVWVNGTLTRQSGTSRTFESPALRTDRDFTYEIRARWNENGREFDQTRQVKVRGGQRENVAFSANTIQ